MITYFIEISRSPPALPDELVSKTFRRTTSYERGNA